MIATFDRDALLSSLTHAANITDRRPIQPILSNILFTLDRDSATLCATDLEVQITTRVSVQTDAGGTAFTIPGRKLLDITKALPEGGSMEFRQDGEKISIRSGKSRFTLQTLPADQFPFLTIPQPHGGGMCDAEAFRSALSVAAVCMGNNDSRFFLNGAAIEVDGDVLRLVSTDGHRLSMMDMSFSPCDWSSAYQGILPRKAVLELVRLLSGRGGPIQIRMSPTSFVLEHGSFQFACKLIDAKYPEYRRVIPDGHPHKALLNRASLREALQQVEIMAGDSNSSARLFFHDGQVVFNAHNEAQEDAEIAMDAEFDGGSLEISFNVKYLMEGAQMFEADLLRMQLRDGGSSALITPVGQNFPVYVVMPVRS